MAAGLVLFWLTSSAFGLDPARKMSQYVHDKWDAARGFVGGRVYAIGQSADGYLWIGTERGLVRFDGANFVLMQRPLPALPPIGRVRSLVADEEGSLWVRLEGPRMLLYRHGKFEDLYARFDLQDITFTASAPDGHGGVLLAGLGDRTFRYRQGHFETLVRAPENPGTVLSMAVTRDERVWLGTRENGLSRIEGGKISKIRAGLDDTKINALLPANNGGLWIGTDRGLKLWDGSALRDIDLPGPVRTPEVLALARDHDANVWVGTSHGMVRIAASGAVAASAESGDAVTAIYEDRDGSIWYGGSSGIERLRNGMFTTYSTAEGLPSESNGPVYADADGRIWFAPAAGGLYWMKDGRVVRVTAGGLDRDVVYSISGGGGEICAGRRNGGLTVLTLNGDSVSARTYAQSDGLAQNSVYSVHRNRDGTIWAGTVSAGVSQLQHGQITNFSENTGLPSNAMNSIVEGHDGTTWFATAHGLVSFANGRWSTRSVRDGLPSSNIKTIFEDKQHVLWIATTAGLAFSASGSIRVPQKLPDGLREQIFGIAEDRTGSLWFTTSDHVLQVNRDHLFHGSLNETDVQSYGISDGLQGVEGVGRDRSLVADNLGRIWASLNRGLSVADPGITETGSAPVAVRVESVSANGNPIDLQSTPKLPSGIESIVFSYGGTNLAMPERTRFRYMLEGSDRGWSDIVASREVTYNNLGPGAYRFRIFGSNSEGLWNGPETVIPFVIEPAFWQTWWFRASCALAFVILIAALYRLRMYQLTRQISLRFRERLAERTRIAQDLHDTLLQGVLSASLQLDLAEDQVPEGSPAKPLLQRVLQLMGKVTEEGRNAVRGLRAYEDGQGSLELSFSRMREEFSLNDKTGYRVVALNTARPLRPIIRDEVYRIGREALVNAFRHAQAESIEVEVEYASRYLRVLVRDDGRGIDPQVLHAGREGHWGLPGMRERSEEIGATLKLRSRVGAGTEVELSVPGPIAFEGEPHGLIKQWLPWLNRENAGGNGTVQSGKEKREHT